MTKLLLAALSLSACSLAPNHVGSGSPGAEPDAGMPGGGGGGGGGGALPADAAPAPVDGTPQPVLGCDQAPVIAGTGAVTSWSRITGKLSVNYFGDGYNTVDMTSFASIWSNPMYPKPSFPGGYDTNANIPLPINKYISAELDVPASYFDSNPTGLWGEISIGESGFSAAVSLSISEHCGDFGQLSPTTVVPGCLKSKLKADGALIWQDAAGDCQLQAGKRYYLNVIDADISTFPATTTLRAQYCVNNICTTPVINGPGTWSN